MILTVHIQVWRHSYTPICNIHVSVIFSYTNLASRAKTALLGAEAMIVLGLEHGTEERGGTRYSTLLFMYFLGSLTSQMYGAYQFLLKDDLYAVRC